MYTAIGGRRHIADLKTLPFQNPAGIQYSLVFNLRRDDMLSTVFVSPGAAQDRQVIRFRCTGGEHDFAGLGAEQ